MAATNAHVLTQQLAYELWQRRGCPLGSPEIDWFAAEDSLPDMRGYSGEDFQQAGSGSVVA